MARIPNVFHFVFGLKQQTEPFHLAFYLCIESCHAVNQPDQIYFYYHHEPWGPYWELARRRVTPVRVPLDAQIARFHYSDPGITQYRYAHLSDFVRLERILEHGGVYADIDTIFVNPIPAHLWDQPFVLGREGDVISTPGGHPHPSSAMRSSWPNRAPRSGSSGSRRCATHLMGPGAATQRSCQNGFASSTLI